MHFLLIEDFHSEIQGAQALFRSHFRELFDLVKNGLVLAIRLQSLLYLRVGPFDVEFVPVVPRI